MIDARRPPAAPPATPLGAVQLAETALHELYLWVLSTEVSADRAAARQARAASTRVKLAALESHLPETAAQLRAVLLGPPVHPDFPHPYFD